MYPWERVSEIQSIKETCLYITDLHQRLPISYCDSGDLQSRTLQFGVKNLHVVSHDGEIQLKAIASNACSLHHTACSVLQAAPSLPNEFVSEMPCQVSKSLPACVIRRIAACSQNVITSEGRKREVTNDTRQYWGVTVRTH